MIPVRLIQTTAQCSAEEKKEIEKEKHYLSWRGDEGIVGTGQHAVCLFLPNRSSVFLPFHSHLHPTPPLMVVAPLVFSAALLPKSEEDLHPPTFTHTTIMAEN